MSDSGMTIVTNSALPLFSPVKIRYNKISNFYGGFLMNHTRSQLLLFGYGFVGIFSLPVDAAFVLAALTAVIISCLNSFLTDARIQTGLLLLYGLISFWCPPFFCFFPAICYGFFTTRKFYSGFLLLFFFLIRGYFTLPANLFFLLLFGFAFSYLLFQMADSYEKLDHLYRQTRDDSTERNLLLKEKNKTLLEKQDTEIYNATLKERNRIAREIHDNVGHLLSRSILMVGALKMISAAQPGLSGPLGNLEATLNDAMDSVRKSVHDLHDESINLKEALENLTTQYTFCKVSLIYDISTPVPRNVKYSFIAIVKEALSNISRHSNATHAQIICREHPGFWQLQISDNGHNTGIIATSGIGLENMRKRIATLNGQISITNTDGFSIFATVPKSKQNYEVK